MTEAYVVDVEVAVATHVGGVRRGNEDVVLVDGCASGARTANWAHSLCPLTAASAVAVIDGMGGHHGGAMAAWLAAKTLADGLPLVTDRETARALVGTVHETIRRAGSGLGLPHMGAAAVALVVTPEGFASLNVGDCRGYRVVDGFLGQLSVDDAAEGGIGGGTVLTASLGGAPDAPTDAHWYGESWTPGDHRFVLVSDGALAVSSDPLALATDPLSHPAEVTAGIIADTLSGGAPDNVSVVVVDVRVRTPTEEPEDMSEE